MARRRRPIGLGTFTNLGAGDYSPLERVRKVFSNVGRKVVRRQACCGHYGEPGC